MVSYCKDLTVPSFENNPRFPACVVPDATIEATSLFGLRPARALRPNVCGLYPLSKLAISIQHGTRYYKAWPDSVNSALPLVAQDRADANFAIMGVGGGFAGWLSSCARYIFCEQRLHFFGTLAVLVVFFVLMMAFQVNLQWFWLLLYAALILPFAPYVTKPEFFFR